MTRRSLLSLRGSQEERAAQHLLPNSGSAAIYRCALGLNLREEELGLTVNSTNVPGLRDETKEPLGTCLVRQAPRMFLVFQQAGRQAGEKRGGFVRIDAIYV